MNRMSSVRMNAVHDKASKAALMRQNAWLHSRGEPGRQSAEAAGPLRARLALPPTPADGVAHDAVQAVFLDFEHRAQRRRAVLRLMLVGVMVLAIFAGTNRASWGLQFALVAVYG